MAKQIGCCGIICSECPAFQATQADDDNKRIEVAKQWSEDFKTEIKPEYINCDGCMSESGRYFSYCMECEIRKCCRERHLVNCAYCNEYPCETLSEFFESVPDAKTILDNIKDDLSTI